MSRYIFVYGTLMGDGMKSRFGDKVTCIGEGFVSGYAIHNVAWYPGVVFNEDHFVVGEVWSIDRDELEIMDTLDAYEGYPNLYIKHEVVATRDTGDSGMQDFLCTMYVYNHEVTTPAIKDGRWNRGN